MSLLYENNVDLEPESLAHHAPDVEQASGRSQISAVSALQLGRRQAINDLYTALPLIVLDIAAVTVALVSARALDSLFSPAQTLSPLFGSAVIAMTVLFQHIHGLYPACGLAYSLEFRRILRTCLMVYAGLAVSQLVRSPTQGFSTFGLALFSVLLVVLLAGLRPMARRLLGRFNWWAQPIAIVGSSPRASALYDRLAKSRHEGIRPAGIIFDTNQHIFDTNQHRKDHNLDSKNIFIGPISDMECILVNAGICRLSVADQDVSNCRDFHLFHGIPHVMFPTALGQCPTEKVRMEEWDGQIELHFTSTLSSPGALMAKRCLDLGLVLSASLLWLPLIVLIGLAIKIFDPGPIFYRQSRVGRFGKSFRAIKFRSMVCNADQKLETYLETHPELQAEWQATHKLKHDPRITCIGKFLRKSSLDELPQLWNVLVGEMSLVGPRPIVDCSNYDREYIEEHPEVFELYKMVRPGVTGMWQISGRNNLPYKQRVSLDLVYLQNWSVMLDIFILWRTVKTALFREGAC